MALHATCNEQEVARTMQHPTHTEQQTTCILRCATHPSRLAVISTPQCARTLSRQPGFERLDFLRRSRQRRRLRSKATQRQHKVRARARVCGGPEHGAGRACDICDTREISASAVSCTDAVQSAQCVRNNAPTRLDCVHVRVRAPCLRLWLCVGLCATTRACVREGERARVGVHMLGVRNVEGPRGLRDALGP